ncbi:hypothetical protein LIER_28976 [Lithospermum erythrorhizon]|uniref:Auxin-responsive protein n=1 Tax=Lithospermum erythrorhizon TaxID=34254 RepID=A0AAV3RKW2_LITER
MELSLSLSLPLSNNSNNNNVRNMSINMKAKKKRSYGKAFDDIDEEEVNSSDIVPKTLSLFVCKPNGEEDSDDHSSSKETIDEEEEKGLIGWPPINRWRKKLCYSNNHHQNHQAGNMFINNYVIRVENGEGNIVRRNGDVIFRGTNPKSMFMKVKMEGVGIARKIDLSAHHSFQTLTHSLMFMFGKCNEKNEAYKLTYEDKDGAWLLAGDEPWGSFVQTVQRLKLIKKEDKI